MQASPDSMEERAAEEGTGGLGKLEMIPVDLWRRVLPAERAVLMRSVCRVWGLGFRVWVTLRRLDGC